MPPKAGKAAVAEQPADAEQQRLQARAFDQGVLSRTRRVCSNTLPPTKQMAKADGKDIVKKSTVRRNRYMLVFNCQIAPAAAGKLGTLAQLDSRHPVMYIDFPEGRLKLFGTLTFPRNKYVVLKLGTKEVLCEDVLESMIVFSESWWVGKAEDNPQEKKLPLPEWLAEARRHEKYDFSSRGSKDDAGRDAAAAELDDMMEEDEPPSQSQRPQRAATRGARGKRQRYNEDSGEDEDEDELEGDSGPEDAAPRKLPRLQPAGAAAQSKQQQQQQQQQQQKEQPIVIDDDSGADGPSAAAEPKPKQGTLDGFLEKSTAAANGSKAAAKPAASPKPAAKPKTTPKSAPKSTGAKRKGAKQQQSDESDALVDLLESSSDEEQGQGRGGGAARGAQRVQQQQQDGGHEELSQPPSSSRPQRAAAGAAAKRLRIESDSSAEEDEDLQEGGSSVEIEEGSGGEGSERPSDDDASEGGASDDALESQEESEYSPSE